MILANRDQALKHILYETGVTASVGSVAETDAQEERIMGLILEAMRRAYTLAESKNELAKMLGEPEANASLEEVFDENAVRAYAARLFVADPLSPLVTAFAEGVKYANALQAKAKP